MIIDCIADLHGFYPKLEGGDLLIVAGDLTARGARNEYVDFDYWLGQQIYKKIIVIGGNHDGLVQEGLFDYGIDIKPARYLEDSGTEFEGLNIWGSPWSLRFDGMNPHCMAFTGSENDLSKKYELIPNDTDILVTHGPPLGMFDEINDFRCQKRAGSLSLAAAIGTISPKLHVFGHIHEGYGVKFPLTGYQPGFVDISHTIFVNASIVNEHYKHVNKPIRIVL